MHRDLDISIEGVSRIEGHASLELKVKQGVVEDLKLSVSEDKRFYTQAVRGKNAVNLPNITSRICGTCSYAHLLCAIESVENALQVQPSEQTVILRKLAAYSMIIRDHAMHLYLFSLPDAFKKESVLEFNEEEMKWVNEGFKVKKAGNTLSTMIGGRAVHPTGLAVGGVLSIPKKEDSLKIIQELKEVRPFVLKIMQFFNDSQFSLQQDTRYVASLNSDFSYIGTGIIDSEGDKIQKKDFMDHFFRVVIPYSEAVGYELEGRDYVVGALSRMNLKKNSLHRETLKDAASFLNVFPSKNIFHNNLAQAIEILHAIDSSIEILEMDFKQEEKIEPVLREGEGIGVIEAPRGLLYYHVKTGSDGFIKDANLVIPTSQNQIRMQIDIKQLVEKLISEDKEKPEVEMEIEKLIRAYDPCMSCATHFLNVKWL